VFVAERSSTGARCQVRGIPIALHLDLGEGVLDLARVFRSQLHGRSAIVFLESMQLRGPRDRHDPRFSREQPRECDLRGGRFLRSRDALEQIHERLIRLPGFL
jgi:hypothetical protein